MADVRALTAGVRLQSHAPALTVPARPACRDEDDGSSGARQARPHRSTRLERHIRKCRGLEDKRRTVTEDVRQLGGEVAADELRRILVHDLDRTGEPVEALLLPGPDEALQQSRALVGRDVDRLQVDTRAARYPRGDGEQLCRNGRSLLTR